MNNISKGNVCVKCHVAHIYFKLLW